MPRMNFFPNKPARNRLLAIAAGMATFLGSMAAAGTARAQSAPIAVDNFYGTVMGRALVVAAPGVLGNDTDADGDSISAALVTDVPPAAGSLSLASDGSLTFTPLAGFAGNAVFTYTASDDEVPPNTSNTATVTIAVAASNEVLMAGCVNESNGLNNVCTANDLTFVELGLGTQSDGCVNPADRLTIFMRGVVQNTTAQTRYDVGMWFPLPDPDSPDPGGLWDFQIDPEGDGASTGVCGVVGLMNPEPIPVTDSCVWDPPPGNLDLIGGAGPWVNGESKDAEKDNCSGVTANSSSTVCDFDGDGRWDDSVIDFVSPLTLDCNDADENGQLDGFVTTSVCLSWGNQPNQVDGDGNDLCDDQSELRPGQKSKCRCEQYQLTNIPAPDLSLSCALPVDINGNPLPAYQIEPGGFIRLAVTYTNSCTCSPDLATEERFRCCTASYLEFPITFDSTLGTVTADPENPAPGTVDWSYATDTFIWRPESTDPNVTNPEGIIAQGESATLYFLFYIDSGVDPSTLPQNTIVDVGSRWANAIDTSGDFINPVDQIALVGDCPFDITATWATVSNVTADVREGLTVVSWETAAEVGAVGFDVYRADSTHGGWVKVNETLVAAIGDGPGGHYHLLDPDAPTEGTVTYKIREMDLRGSQIETRPVSVELRRVAAAAPRNDLSKRPRQPSARLVRVSNEPEHGAPNKQRSTTVRQSPDPGRHKPSDPTTIKIGVASTGLHRLSAAEIAAAWGETTAKINTRIAQNSLALTTGGQPVAWRADDHDNGIVFFGQAPDSIYDAERYYVLQVERGLEIEDAGGYGPQPVAVEGTFVDSVTAEEDLLLRPFNVVDEGEDFWFWAAVLADDPDFGEQQLVVELADVAAVDASARVSVDFVGFAPGDVVNASVFINDHYVGDLYGSILAHSTAAFGFSQANLVSGPNTVRIVGRQGGVLIDVIEFDYERGFHASAGELTVRGPGSETISIDGFSTYDVDVYDVTEPLRPVLLPSGVTLAADGASTVVSFDPTTGEGHFLAVGPDAVRQPASILGRPRAELRAGGKGADYLIVTTADLFDAAGRLALYRQDSGLDSMVVDVEDIFDDFGFGARDPAALRAFLSYAANSWTTPPRYVLLAGRGHYDYKNLMGYGGNLVPPMLAATNRGLVPSDNKLADLNGDGQPDLAMGRLPVLTVDELESAIDKIIAYEIEPTDAWAQKVMLAADDPDIAGDFSASSDRMAAAVLSDHETEKVYLLDPYSASEVTSLMVGALEEGIGIVNWTGHAGFDSLANERVLTIADLADLNDTAHPSLVVGLSCLINNFGFPYFASLGEEMALQPRGGAIGVWAASGLSNNTHAEVLGESFMATLGGQAPRRLGDRILDAMDDYWVSHADRTLLNEYVLFADPALVLK